MINPDKPLLRLTRTGWMCTFPPKSVMMNQCTTAIKATPKEAYEHCMALVRSAIEDPFVFEPTPKWKIERWADAEARQLMGLHRSWSSLDCKVRNGY